MAAQQVTIASTVPIGTLHMPLKQLRDKGVFCHDRHRQRDRPLVTVRPGDMLEKANLYAQLYIRPNEQTLSRALGIATGDVLPLNDKGERVWPKAQDDASFVLVDASCSCRGGWRAFHRAPRPSIRGTLSGARWVTVHFSSPCGLRVPRNEKHDEV